MLLGPPCLFEVERPRLHHARRKLEGAIHPASPQSRCCRLNDGLKSRAWTLCNREVLAHSLHGACLTYQQLYTRMQQQRRQHLRASGHVCGRCNIIGSSVRANTAGQLSSAPAISVPDDSQVKGNQHPRRHAPSTWILCSLCLHRSAIVIVDDSQ